MSRHMDRFLPPVLAILLALVALNSADTIRKWWVGAGPAVQWQGVEVMTQTVKPGGQIEAVYSAIIRRQCPSEVRGFVVDASNGTVPVRFPVVWGGYVMPDPEPVKIRVSITMPRSSDPGLAPLRAGKHVYRTLVTRYCPTGVEADNLVPDVPFFLEVPQ